MTYPKCVIAGENSIIVYVGDKANAQHPLTLSIIDKAVRDKFGGDKFGGGIVDTVPSYISILITYNPHSVSAQGMMDFINTLDLWQTHHGEHSTILEVPVCYDRRCGADIDALLASNDITYDEMISLHSTPAYVVQAVGFIPGMPFLGPVHEKLVKGRHQSPRAMVPKGSVGIAGTQTGIYPVATPGGWQLIGRTPLNLANETITNANRGAEDMATMGLGVTVGDTIQFTPIDFDTYKDMGGES